MRLGIFAKTFQRPTLEGVLDAVRARGFLCIQFNLACAGLPSMPDQLDPAQSAAIGQAVRVQGLSMAAVSGTFNMIHPDPQARRKGLDRLRCLAFACPSLGTETITLCTGTRDPLDMWRRHPDNDRPEAWSDLLTSMTQAVAVAEEAGVTLALEPEVANVVDSAVKARRLLDQIRSPRLKVVLDPANLFHAGDLPRMRSILAEAFDLLGTDIVLAHAKDITRDGEAGHAAAGTGLLDYPAYIAHLRKINYAGPLILHGLAESQAPSAVAFLNSAIEGNTRSLPG